MKPIYIWPFIGVICSNLNCNSKGTTLCGGYFLGGRDIWKLNRRTHFWNDALLKAISLTMQQLGDNLLVKTCWVNQRVNAWIMILFFYWFTVSFNAWPTILPDDRISHVAISVDHFGWSPVENDPLSMLDVWCIPSRELINYIQVRVISPQFPIYFWPFIGVK